MPLYAQLSRNGNEYLDSNGAGFDAGYPAFRFGHETGATNTVVGDDRWFLVKVWPIPATLVCAILRSTSFQNLPAPLCEWNLW